MKGGQSLPDGKHNGLICTVDSYIVAGPQDAAMPLAHDEAARGDACQGCNGFVVGLSRRTTSSIEAQVVHLQRITMI